MDPDYELPQTVREEANKRREKEKHEQIEKARAKVRAYFQGEIEQREDQLIDIQNCITCLAKTLHVLRYVLVTSYYNNPEAQVQPCEEELQLVDKQPRLHPAVKRLTSERELSQLDFSGRKTRRTQRQGQKMPIAMDAEVHKASIVKETPASHPKQERVNSHSTLKPPDECATATIPRNRQMTKRRIIIGNISKWMPSENSEDTSTHKWMIYVRGPPQNPAINDIIEKIVFHLHPSYRPHDVIEICNHPFHLTRRGWGEFPVRCQIVFTHHLNKPVNVIHHLKLDKFFTGRQILGNETIVDLTLYDENAQLDEEPLPEITTTEAEERIAFHDQSTDVSPAVVPPDCSAEHGVSAKIAKQLLVNDFSHSAVKIKDEILDPSYMDVENIEILETSLPMEDIKLERDEHDVPYFEHCPALSDHTYSLRCVRSC